MQDEGQTEDDRETVVLDQFEFTFYDFDNAGRYINADGVVKSVGYYEQVQMEGWDSYKLSTTVESTIDVVEYEGIDPSNTFLRHTPPSATILT